LPVAKAISEIFSEVIIAPEFATDARALLQKKKNLRLMRALPTAPPNDKPEIDVRSGRGGLPGQERDGAELEGPETKVVATGPPTKREMTAMLFGWRVVKH